MYLLEEEEMVPPEYFYKKEKEYEEWLKKNPKGFVVNNLQGENPKPCRPNESDGGLRLHNVGCRHLKRPKDVGKRTFPYGKYCNCDERILSQECKRRFRKVPRRCLDC